MIGHQEFLDLLAVEFPEIATKLRQEGTELLHLEVAALREAAEHAMDLSQFWTVEKHFRFVERMMYDATPEVENALETSYIEDLALGDCTPERYRAIKERMPTNTSSEDDRHSSKLAVSK